MPSTGSATCDDFHCLVCGGDYKADRIPGLFRCWQCGFVSADFRLEDSYLQALYAKEYFFGNEYRDYQADETELKVNFSNRWEQLKRVVPRIESCKVFEVGCAFGYFLDAIKGSVKEVGGVDISADAVAYATKSLGLAAICGDYTDVSFSQPRDLIVMWDTIEHLKRPDIFIDKASRDLADGGYLALTTGDIGALMARVRGKHWRMIHPPTHLHYFSVPTLTKLLERYGFEVVHISHPGNARKLRSMLFAVLQMRWGLGWAYDRLKAIRILDIALTVNFFDIMFVIARKRG